MYSRHNSGNYSQPMQMELSKNVKTFPQFFVAFLKSTSNFEHFDKNDDPNSSSISEITDSKRGGYFLGEEVLFQNSLRQ